MALKLYPPGTRRPGTYVILGHVSGAYVERSAKTSSLPVARQRMRELEEKLGDVPSLRSITFAQAAERYTAFRDPSHVDRQRLEKVSAYLGKRRLRDITPADLHEMASVLGKGTQPATRNRNFLRPAITVLHYAAKGGLCPWLRVERFKEARPKTRAVDRDTGIIAAVNRIDLRRKA